MSKEPHWVRVTRTESIPLREGRAVEVEGKELAIFNLGERSLAIENRCPHRGGPLADGIVSGNMVVCPLHAWKVCLEDGSVVKPAEERACLKSYRTCVEDGVVSVEIPGTEPLEAEREIPALISTADLDEARGRPDLEMGPFAG